MKTVFLQWPGRLANQMLCVANALHFIETHGLSDVLVGVRCRQLDDSRITLPHGVVLSLGWSNYLPVVSRDGVLTARGDCVWSKNDIWTRFPDHASTSSIIRRFQPSKGFVRDINAAAGARCVGVHVRYGDYAESGGQFNRAPRDYYLGWISDLYRIGWRDFFIATDGNPHEIEYLSHLSGIRFGRRGDPLFDLYALASCSIIVGSESTFSSVASMLGNRHLILPSSNKHEHNDLEPKQRISKCDPWT